MLTCILPAKLLYVGGDLWFGEEKQAHESGAKQEARTGSPPALPKARLSVSYVTTNLAKKSQGCLLLLYVS